MEWEKRLVLVTYTLCGMLIGLVFGLFVDLFLSFWMNDGAAFMILCAFCAAIVGFQVGEKKLYPD